MGRQRTWTEPQLIEAVRESRSMAEVLRRLGLKQAGGTQRYLNEVVRHLKLDTTHFKGHGWNQGARQPRSDRKSALLSLLRKGVRVSRLRDRLIASGLKDPRCEECGITEWQGNPAPLQVDHIDGDRWNNELENLRILCANCHMLTDTWGFKNGRRRNVWVNIPCLTLPGISMSGDVEVSPGRPTTVESPRSGRGG